MIRMIWLAAAFAFGTASAVSEPAPKVEIRRLDCGTFGPKPLVNSCYLIRHGDQLMIWDAGFPGEWVGQPPAPERRSVVVATSLVDALARIGIAPDAIDIVAVSHHHWDHVGQAASFPKARLLIGKADWDVLAATQPDRFEPWIDGGAPLETIDGDKDVFGDGSVVMFATPGHTAGHHSLLVRTPRLGAVMLSGDLYSSTAQHAEKRVSKGNADAAQTIASFRRFDAMAQALKATVIIQHEPADVAKLTPRGTSPAGAP